MSNNNFYNNFRGSTFQNNFMPPFSVPPPPHPPPELFVVPIISHAPNFDVIDQEYVKTFENITLNAPALKKNNQLSISQVQDRLRNLALSLNELKRQERELTDKANTCSEEEWKDAIQKVEHKKILISDLLSNINTYYLDVLKKLIAKRMAKRQRLKRLRIEKKRVKEDRIKEMKEKSRKIDENLQKIKDAINKDKQEEESKLQADIILKEVLRKKHNAKKFISKLDALKKLRSARLNTAKGRGENLSLYESDEFDGKIEKLKLLWAQKLLIYEKEEEDLRSKLKHDSDIKKIEESLMEKQAASNLKKWRKVLFGEATASPQVDFSGDIARFVAVRCQWDQYGNESGSSIPIGWVTPARPSD